MCLLFNYSDNSVFHFILVREYNTGEMSESLYSTLGELYRPKSLQNGLKPQKLDQPPVKILFSVGKEKIN